MGSVFEEAAFEGAIQNQAQPRRNGGGDFGGSMPIVDPGRHAGRRPLLLPAAERDPEDGASAPTTSCSRWTRPYDDLYTWDIADFVENAQYRPQPPDNETQDVWHTIRFTNTSKQPFSTGVATIFKDNQIIGQDTMRYASPGGKAELQITKAMDVSADQLEEEISRDRGALKNTYNTITHDLVTLKGTLTLVNRKRRR